MICSQPTPESFEANREAEMTLPEYLEACRDDPMMYATATERLLAAIGEPEMVDTAKDARLGRIFMNRTIRVYPAFSEFYGMEETIERIVGFLRHAAQGLEERKQIMYLLGPVGGGKSSLAERLKALMESASHLCAEGRRPSSARCSKARSACSTPSAWDAMLEDRYGIPQRRLTGLMSPWCIKRLDEFDGDISRFRVAKLLPVAAAPDRHRQDRAGRREQPGHLLAGRQGRYPQAGVARPERSGRLQLFRRPQSRQPGTARIRRDVQGADQDAAPVADRDAGEATTSAPRTSAPSRSAASSWPTPTRRSGRPSRTTATTKPSSTAST